LILRELRSDKIIAAQTHGWGERDWSAFTGFASLNAGQEQMEQAARGA
jgi:hypothetical protein